MELKDALKAIKHNIMKNYALLINTCDNFEDCWDPFFKLFKEFWPEFNGTLYLNTEYKDYNYPGLDIIAIKGCAKHNYPKDKRATWSQCLKWALECIDEEIVLYMQEDYFLKAEVKNDIVTNYVTLIKNNQQIDCIHLTDQSVKANGTSKYSKLDEVLLKQRYRISCQAALWRKETFNYYIRERESAWEFEEFGSKRAAKEAHNFYVIDRNWVKLNEFEIIPYIFTGIIGGRWKSEVVQLFEKRNITIDFNKRGFHENRPPKPINKKVKYHLTKIPIFLRHYYETFFAKTNLN